METTSFDAWLHERSGVGSGISLAVSTSLETLGIIGERGLLLREPSPALMVASADGLVTFQMDESDEQPWRMRMRLTPWSHVLGVEITAVVRQEDVGARYVEATWKVSCKAPPVAEYEVREYRRDETLSFWMQCYRQSEAARAGVANLGLGSVSPSDDKLAPAALPVAGELP